MELDSKDRVRPAGINLVLAEGSSTKKSNLISSYCENYREQIGREVNSVNCNNSKNLWETKYLQKLPLAETIFTLPRVIDTEAKVFAKSDLPEFLWLDDKEVKPKILLIENQDDSRNIVASILRLENFQVIEAKKSNIALNLAKTERPHLIICELMMPIIDGYGILHLLRQSHTTKRIPLVFITFQSPKKQNDSGLILLDNEGAIEVLTAEKLLTEVTNKLKKAIANVYKL